LKIEDLLNIESGRWPNVARRFYYGSVKEYHRWDHIHQWVLRIIAFSVVSLLFIMIGFLLKMSWPALSQFGLGFLVTNEWNPVTEEYGGLAFIFGTLITSLLAIFMASPLSIGIALYVTQICPRLLRYPITFLVEMLAAIPSIVYGLWALFFLCPMVRNHFAPFIQETLDLSEYWIFEGPSFGIGILSASIILAIMIIPTITAVSVEVYKTIPKDLSHAALALGATRWESIKLAVFQPGLKGVFGAIILGMGRAFGETMAVAMVIGNKSDISLSLFAPGATMASVIANEYAEATSDTHMASLALIGLTLFAVSFIINLIARAILWSLDKETGNVI
jgi:phosphate transport system permease protein